MLQAERGVPGAVLPSQTREQTRVLSQTLLVLNYDGVGGFAVDPAEVIESGTGAFGGNHTGTNGLLRGTGSTEDFAFPRLNPSG